MVHSRGWAGRGASAFALAVTAGSVSGQIALPPAQAEVIEAAEVQSVRSAPVRFVVPLGIRCATLPDGTEVDMPSEEVWKPVCSNRVPLTVLDLQTMVATHAADFADPALVRVVDRQNGYAPRVGLNVVFSLGASVPAAAVPAFVAAEAYLEGQFTADTMTVTIPISFAALSPGVIGGTGSSYGSLTWASTRSTLVAGMDGTDTIQSFLPTASLPVRYSTSSTTNENQTFWTFANFKANGGSVAGNDASMQYSTAFPFDYDPSNGVSAGTISLQDVIIHETGHALGCTSGVDFRNRDLEVFDVFRFRRTDGSSDFNPDTTAEFTARPRWCVRNNPNDDVNLDVIGAAEYAVSDGSPYQASHFREQVPAIGIMDPAFSYGETFYPNFMRTSDITLFDAIGYNR